MKPKIDTFDQVGFRDLTNLGVDNVVFWIFWKFFKTYFGSIWALFPALEDLFFCVFSCLKVDIRPQKSKCFIKNMLILAVLKGHFGPNRGSNKSFSGLFRSFL